MLTRKENSAFKIAKEVSELSNITRQKIGAVLVTPRGTVVGVGANIRKTHPWQAQLAEKVGLPHKHFLHAEMQCLSLAKSRRLDVSDHLLFVYREDRNGNLAMCRPCKICMEGILELGIKTVYYTTPNGYAKEEIIKRGSIGLPEIHQVQASC